MHELIFLDQTCMHMLNRKLISWLVDNKSEIKCGASMFSPKIKVSLCKVPLKVLAATKQSYFLWWTFMLINHHLGGVTIFYIAGMKRPIEMVKSCADKTCPPLQDELVENAILLRGHVAPAPVPACLVRLAIEPLTLQKNGNLGHNLYITFYPVSRCYIISRTTINALIATATISIRMNVNQHSQDH